jgi:RNA polymerase sigma-70 factor (ECF subfamily)
VSDFLEEFVPRVYHFALRLTGDAHVAEDLTQETLLRAWSRRGQLRQWQCTRTWLFRIVGNLWRDHLRRAVLREGRRRELSPKTPCPEHDPADAAAMRDDLRLVLAALDELPPRQREVLYLAACEAMPLAEIAQVLAISPDAVKSNLAAARKQMRQRLRGRL